MKKKNLKLVLAISFLLLLGFGLFVYVRHHLYSQGVLTIYGNVDIREVQLAFYDTGRILKMYVQEGQRVKKGQLLAELDPVRFEDAVREAEHTVELDKAALENAEITYRRDEALAKEQFVSLQERDNAFAALKEARNKLKADEARLSLAKRELQDAKLYAPQDGVIEDRILEPGDMVTPQTAVFTMALDQPVWVRAYVPESYLGKIFLGMKAEILTDSYPGKVFHGWIGFISPVSEFTPKNVETPDLRTKLVYQVRVYSENSDYRLRLGMPATVRIPLKQSYPPEKPPLTME
ncbi:efflux RND transporter periplasmic adaptor subunit [Methylacidiphilum caldifontis]|uniref:Efflux transporter periplasmic adaptor subunit n=1 Tax=Methylacidiphilum caldifontis TaxID=2795386 RepID=A0A4Y8PHS9_9BACT|nr:efflux RND transporter periplasmic adaptor subunit [Methylacidiphilum caldifontis]QSR88657.1 efflux RND transporter periplasmic adaptor subunit [Methylacidiphilum caldifontis]TFE73278.1 efflux transporter periplasmic adaptor subunit [Methylacidiphilum caldifontis]